MEQDHLDDGLIRRQVSHHLRAYDEDHLTITTEHLYSLEAARPARFFQRRYTWTGNGTEGRPYVYPHADLTGHTSHKLQGPVIQVAPRVRLMVVDLGTTLGRISETQGERVDLKISHRFVDTAGMFKRFLGHTARDGCERISLKVTLPHGVDWPVEGVIQREGETKRLGRADPIHEVKSIGRAEVSQYSWDIDQPTPLHSYLLVWSPDGKI